MDIGYEAPFSSKTEASTEIYRVWTRDAMRVSSTKDITVTLYVQTYMNEYKSFGCTRELKRRLIREVKGVSL